MFTIYVFFRCLKEKVKPNIVAILFLFIIDTTLIFSLLGLTKLKAGSIYYTEGRAGDVGNGAYVYYDTTYCPVRFSSSNANNFCKYENGYYIPSQEKSFIDHFYQAFPNYFTENYTIIFNRSSDYSNNYRALVLPKANITLLQCTFEGLGETANGITATGIQWKYAVTSGAKQYNGSVNSTSFGVENWNNSATWYCNGSSRCIYTGVCWNAYIPITNNMSNYTHNYSYYWDDRDFFMKKPSLFNTHTDLAYMKYDKLSILLNGSSVNDLTFQLYECDENGNALANLDWFFELSNLNENSPYYWSNEENSGFDIPFYNFVDVNLKSGKLYNWCLIGTINGTTFIIDNVVMSNVTWDSTAGVNSALINSQNNTSNSIQNQTDWQQQSASGDLDFNFIDTPNFNDPTGDMVGIFNNIVSAISNWEAEPLVLKIPRSENGHSTPPYILQIDGDYVEERLKWMFTTYDDMSVNPSHSGFIVINIVKTIWLFVFSRWVYRIVKKLVDSIRSGKILDNNIEDITSDML